jgi:hypothetical protein
VQLLILTKDVAFVGKTQRKLACSAPLISNMLSSPAIVAETGGVRNMARGTSAKCCQSFPRHPPAQTELL